ncbi:MAG: hypothetical protein AB7H97_19875, partial [Pseudobdellovibrionaceae bacterium]
MARVEVPAYRRGRYDGNSSTPSSYENSDAETIVVGWFGASSAVADKKVCYDTGRQDISYLFQSSSTTPLIWDPTKPPGASTVIVRGGTGFSSTPPPACAEDTRNFTSLYFDSKRMNWMHEGFGGFSGPFQVMRTSQGYDTLASSTVTSSTSTSRSVSVSMKLLPGITASLFTGVHVFKTGNADFRWNEDGVPCAALNENRIEGFEKIASPGLSGSSRDFQFDFSSSVDGTGTPGIQMIALCPYKDGIVYNGGAFLKGHELFPYTGSGPGGSEGDGGNPCVGSNCGPQMSPPAGIVISKHFPTNVHTGGCSRFYAYLVDANGNRTMNSSTETISFQVKKNDNLISVYGTEGDACSGTALSTLSFAPNENERHFSVLVSESTTISIKPHYLAGTTGFQTPTSSSFSYRDPSNLNNKKAHVLGPSGLVADQCYPFSIQVTDYMGIVKTPTEAWSLDLSVTDINTLKVYLNATCTNQVTSTSKLSFSAGVPATRIFYAKLSPTSTSGGAQTLRFYSSTLAIDEGGITVFPSSLSSGSLTQFQLLGTSDFTLGLCHPIMLQPVQLASGAANAVVPSAAITGLNFSVSGSGASGTFHSSSTCADSAPTGYPAGQGALVVYFKPLSSSPGVIAVGATNLTPSQANYHVQNISLPPAKLAIRKKGGSLNKLEGDYCYEFEARTLDANENPTATSVPVNLKVSSNSTGTAPLTIYSGSTSEMGTQISGSNLTIPAKSSFVTFYYKPPYVMSGSQAVIMYGVHQTASAPLQALSWSGLAVPYGYYFVDFMLSPQKVLPGLCYRMELGFWSLSGFPYMGTPDPLPSVTLSSAPGAAFYSNSGCTSLVSSPISVSSGHVVYYKIESNTIGSDFPWTLTPATSNWAESAGVFRKGQGSNTLHTIALGGSAQIPYNNCQPYKVELLNSEGTTIQLSTAQTFNLSVDGDASGPFFANSIDCGNDINSVTQISTAASVFPIYFKGLRGAINGHLHVSKSGGPTSDLLVKISGPHSLSLSL